MNEPNAVMALLLELAQKADSLYVQVGRRTMRLDDPDLPTERGVRFVCDRLRELIPD